MTRLVSIARCMFGFGIICVVSLVDAGSSFGQRKVDEFTGSGVVRKIKPGQITIRDADGEERTYKIQNTDEDALSIGGRPIAIECEISVAGVLPIHLLEFGMVMEFQGRVNRAGKSEGQITGQVNVLDVDSSGWKLDYDEKPEGLDFVDCDIIGRVVYTRPKRGDDSSIGSVMMGVPNTPLTRKGRVRFEVADDASFSMSDNSLNRVRRGDIVKSMSGIVLDTDDWVITSIDIELSPDREPAVRTFHDEMELRFSDESDEPAEPRALPSPNFLLYTDVSDRQAKVMLAKLELMYQMVTTYYGRKPQAGKIETYLVKDLESFQRSKYRVDHNRGIAKIQEGAGVTVTYTLSSGGRESYKAVVYSCDNQRVCQHEAVHALCGQAFGDQGPIWYAEGMAEMGQYWEPGSLEVRVDPFVIEYLTSAEPKPLEEIIKLGQVTGDSWQAYSWRWALCHMMANSPNYSREFKYLGLAMMKGETINKRPDGDPVTFESAFKDKYKQIKFEYDEFVKYFGNGYRADLCAWDWETEPAALEAEEFRKKTVVAKAGWQASGIRVKKGVEYEFMCLPDGRWKIEPDSKELTGDGRKDGVGALVATIYDDFEITDQFKLGHERGSFVAEQDGHLFLRCNDDWLELGDNEGELDVYFQMKK